MMSDRCRLKVAHVTEWVVAKVAIVADVERMQNRRCSSQVWLSIEGVGCENCKSCNG
jgi:hypothetical protein